MNPSIPEATETLEQVTPMTAEKKEPTPEEIAMFERMTEEVYDRLAAQLLDHSTTLVSS